MAISHYRTLEQTYNRIDAKLVYDPNDYNTYEDVSFMDFKQEMGTWEINIQRKLAKYHFYREKRDISSHVGHMDSVFVSYQNN